MLNVSSTCTAGSTPAGSPLMQRRLTFLRRIFALLCVGACALANGASADQPQAPMTETATAKANAVLIKNAYEAFSRGDIPGAMAAFAPDIFWHVPGRGPLARDYRGHDEVFGFFGHFMQLSNGTFQLRVDDVLAQGDRVVVLCTNSAERGGHSWTSPEVHVWTVKDGKATVFWEYQGDQQAEDEFWSSPG
jgi:uncharacterized protein